MVERYTLVDDVELARAVRVIHALAEGAIQGITRGIAGEKTAGANVDESSRFNS